ncbi:MBL fold metallo-hydrolase [Xylophilus sp. GOD-11R]|uniref:MBL fold metallo-hydrolase n=1 Tax=Xylophilus sp. GOD-11R TaxID=3089814 RepID=UPI00298C262A|nr:MBL fold metallo-hydrolase [Xylophilus sp. GOD-11R]WPB56774.1 MBL fold metallo-hydrolase [Xylophilus sp. GOD-11R]
MAAVASALLLAGCQHVNPYYDASKPHHRPDGFQNRYLEFQPKGLQALARWRWEAWRQDLPKAPASPPPTVTPDLAFIRANAAAGGTMVPSMTFIGHASALLQIPLGDHGLQVLTDPVFSERASPLSFIGPKRAQPPGMALADLPHIDLILITHNHYDHLDEASIRALAAQPGGPPLFVVPLGIAAWMRSHGVADAVELDWFESHTIERDGAVAEVTLTPSQHWSGRSLGDRLQTLWGGYALLAPEFHFWFAGDTGYSKDFADIGARFAPRQTPESGGGFDLAMIPIGAYEPRWFMREQHVNPAESVRIHQDVGAKRSIGVHWGTFNLTDEPSDQAPLDLAVARRAAGLPDDAFTTLAIGQTLRLPRRTTASKPA